MQDEIQSFIGFGGIIHSNRLIFTAKSEYTKIAFIIFNFNML